MKRYQVRIPPDVEAFLRRLHPQIKSKIRAALDLMETDPFLGKPLKGPLSGLRSYRVSRYRIVYQIHARRVLIEVMDIAERRIIYERVVALLKKG